MTSGGGIRKILDSLRRRNGYGEKKSGGSETTFGSFASAPLHGNVGNESAVRARGEVETASAGGGTGCTLLYQKSVVPEFTRNSRNSTASRFEGRGSDESSVSVQKTSESSGEVEVFTSGAHVAAGASFSSLTSSTTGAANASFTITNTNGSDQLSSLNNGDSRITAQGWMQKRGNVNRSWQSRYFVLWNDSVLYYFESEPEVRAFLRGEEPKDSSRGFIDLQTATEIRKGAEDSDVIEIVTPTRVWELKPLKGGQCQPVSSSL